MAYNEKLLVESAQRGDTDAQKAIYSLLSLFLSTAETDLLKAGCIVSS